MGKIKLYAGDYTEERQEPICLTFITEGTIERVYSYATEILVPQSKPGLDFYFKTKTGCFGYYRDLLKYPPQERLLLLKH